MRRTLGPILLIGILLVLAATLATRALEYRDQIVTVESEKGVRHFAAPGLVVPLWMAHESWTGPVEAGKPQQFARVDIRKGLYAKPELSTVQAAIAGVLFPLVLVGAALFSAVMVFRYRWPQTPAAK